MNDQQLQKAIQEIESLLQRCKKAQQTIKKGTSQDTLLINRLFALEVSLSLCTKENNKYSKEDCGNAMVPINSIISKCEKAIQKFEEGQPTYTRLFKTLQVMYIAKQLVEEMIDS